MSGSIPDLPADALDQLAQGIPGCDCASECHCICDQAIARARREAFKEAADLIPECGLGGLADIKWKLMALSKK